MINPIQIQTSVFFVIYSKIRVEIKNTIPSQIIKCFRRTWANLRRWDLSKKRNKHIEQHLKNRGHGNLWIIKSYSNIDILIIWARLGFIDGRTGRSGSVPNRCIYHNNITNKLLFLGGIQHILFHFIAWLFMYISWWIVIWARW